MNATDFVYLEVTENCPHMTIRNKLYLRFDTALEAARQQSTRIYSWEIFTFFDGEKVVLAQSIAPDAEAEMSSSQPPQIAPDVETFPKKYTGRGFSYAEVYDFLSGDSFHDATNKNHENV